MDSDEKDWVEESISLADKATRMNVTVLMFLTPECSDNCYVVTNAKTADMIKEMSILRTVNTISTD